MSYKISGTEVINDIGKGIFTSANVGSFTTSTRPTSGISAGDIIFNSTLGILEVYDGSTWLNANGGGGYVDDVFSTDVWPGTGTGTNHRIQNGIDFEAKGGMVWAKQRTDPSEYATIVDTERGGDKILMPSEAWGTFTSSDITFNEDGFSLGSAVNYVKNNLNKDNVAWSFRKAPGFFDVVTYTGTGGGGASQYVPHSLGSVPGMIIVKQISAIGYEPPNYSYGELCWYVQHRYDTTKSLLLNSTIGEFDGDDFDNTAPTSSVFTVRGYGTNTLGESYVAYIFAHDDQSFGTDGDESIIKCGSFSTDANGMFNVDLGWEPQWLLIKRYDGSDSSTKWLIFDVMREMGAPSSAALFADSSEDEETRGVNGLFPTSTGFRNAQVQWFGGGDDFIYMAIRRPHKPPEAATEVFNAIRRSGTSGNVTVDSNMGPVDMLLTKSTVDATANVLGTRMLGPNGLTTSSTAAENTNVFGSSNPWDVQEGVNLTSDGDTNASFRTYINYFFKRAPGFFDVVAYPGTNSTHTEAHNLGVEPELIIIKTRDSNESWRIYAKPLGNTYSLILPYDYAKEGPQNGWWAGTTPVESQFSLGTEDGVNKNTDNYIAYLFASCPGVSKVDSYTGTGSDVNVDCGFTAGARFVLIKRTDSTGDWYVWDSVRGIVAGNDPYLLINGPAAAEVINTDYIDPLTTGFTITSSAPDAVNASGGTYIYLAIA